MLFKKRKYFYFSKNELNYKEVRFFSLKVISTIFTSVVFLIGLVLFVNFIIYNFMNLGHDRINKIVAENKNLRAQIVLLSGTIGQLKDDLDMIKAQGEKFRLMVDLPKLEKDELKVGIGGSVSRFDAKQIMANKDNALAQINFLTDQLSREVEQQRESYNKILEKYSYNQKLFAAIPALKPMDGYYSSKGFGRRMHPVLGIFKTHDGLDIINNVGTSVYAAGDGTIEFAGRSGGGYGIIVVINHGFGYQTLYAHLSKVIARAGSKVKRGDLIAKSGRTGLVSGPHLHYEVMYKGVKQNPIDFFFDDISPRVYSKSLANK
jgi:murein DD-endopeptidase MepM/ murein hydrolase activator NlpD